MTLKEQMDSVCECVHVCVCKLGLGRLDLKFTPDHSESPQGPHKPASSGREGPPLACSVWSPQGPVHSLELKNDEWMSK